LSSNPILINAIIIPLEEILEQVLYGERCQSRKEWNVSGWRASRHYIIYIS